MVQTRTVVITIAIIVLSYYNQFHTKSVSFEVFENQNNSRPVQSILSIECQWDWWLTVVKDATPGLGMKPSNCTTSALINSIPPDACGDIQSAPLYFDELDDAFSWYPENMQQCGKWTLIATMFKSPDEDASSKAGRLACDLKDKLRTARQFGYVAVVIQLRETEFATAYLSSIWENPSKYPIYPCFVTFEEGEMLKGYTSLDKYFIKWHEEWHEFTVSGAIQSIIIILLLILGFDVWHAWW